MNFIVPLVIYPFDIMFSLGETDKQLRKSLRKTLHKDAFDTAYNDDFLCELNPESTKAGKTLFITGHRQTIVILGRCPGNGVVAHEIFHAVEMIMRYLKMPLSTENDEAYAYLIGYVTDEFYRNMK